MRRFSTLLLTLTVVAAACTSAQPEDGGSDLAGSPGGDFLALLATVPDTPDTRIYVLLNDYGAAAAQAGLLRPASESSDTEAAGYLSDLTFEHRLGLSALPAIWGPNVASVEAWRNELGFSILDVDRDVFAGVPPHRYRIMLGRIDPENVQRAVVSDPNFSDLLETAEHHDTKYFTWGSQAEADLSRKSAARPVGRGGQLAVLDDRIIWTLNEGAMEAALDTRSGTTPSLAEFEDFHLAALSLESVGAYTAILTNGVLAVEDVVRFASAQRPEAAEEIRRLQAESGFLLRYTALGIGASLGSDGAPRAVIVLVNSDEDAALENATRLEDIITNGRSVFTGSRWSDLARVDTVTTEGRLTVGVLRTSSPSYFLSFIDEVDSLLLYTTGG